MARIVDLFLLFFTYSLFGWCIEVVLKYFKYHRFINRGFLTGPWLPIYGSGAALITLAAEDVSRVETAYGTTFVIAFFLCGAIEYLSSYFMEKRYHARWWDYSQKPMNLNGRVWIGNLVLFGLGGVAVVHLINPLLYALFSGIRLPVREVLAGVLAAVIAADFIVSHFVLKLVKAGIESSEADSTEAISREVRLLLSDRSIFYRRFADAYPEVIYRTERISARLAAIRTETERLRREAEQRIGAIGQRFAQGREQLAATIDPAAVVRSDVIRRQDELIRLLYDEDTASEEMRGLKREIDEGMEKLNARKAPRAAEAAAAR